MSKIYLAIYWHQHQPYYRDTLSNTFIMPWVRLHGIKDYYGIAALLKEFPQIKANINLVPSLLKQLKEYESGQTTDRMLELTKKPAEQLNPADKLFILENFFNAHLENMIGALPRYKELWSKIHQRGKTFDYWTNELAVNDFRDLQVLANLAWFHPLIAATDVTIKQLRTKGKDYTEEDKQLVIKKQFEIISQLIPLHKSMQDSGQLELTTTPFYHPILPLLCNSSSARVALPGTRLPVMQPDEFLEDARWQVQEAVKLYTEYFGQPPRGMWPAEGSVSPEIIPLLAEAGIKWFASDEEILAHSLNLEFIRDNYGHLVNYEPLYQPYQVSDKDGHKLSIIFRNQHLSNLIGFQYQRWNQEDAARDLIGQIKYGLTPSDEHPTLVSIILDGENAWEHYPGNGVDFLRHFYTLLAQDKDIETVRISDFLEKHPPKNSIPKLYSGSWINHNFAIWIGDAEDLQGWKYLLETRRFLKSVSLHPEQYPNITPEKLQQAWENIHIAEGSDWFWWFGPEHASSLDTQFDALFRTHLINVYKVLGQPIPDYLYKPIKNPEKFESYSSPIAFSSIKLDGKRTDYFEWIAAGHYSVAHDKTVMDYSTKKLVQSIYFGFNDQNAYFRIDSSENIRKIWPAEYSLQLTFLSSAVSPAGRNVTADYSRQYSASRERDPASAGKAELPDYKPQERKLIVSNLLGQQPSFDIVNKNGQKLHNELKSIACADIIEIECPFQMLDLKPYDTVEFFVDILQNDSLVERYPATVPINFQVPSKEFDTVNWQA